MLLRLPDLAGVRACQHEGAPALTYQEATSSASFAPLAGIKPTTSKATKTVLTTTRPSTRSKVPKLRPRHDSKVLTPRGESFAIPRCFRLARGPTRRPESPENVSGRASRDASYSFGILQYCQDICRLVCLLHSGVLNLTINQLRYCLKHLSTASWHPRMSHLSTEQIKKLCWEGSSCSTLTETRKNNTTHASHYPDLKHCSTNIRKKRDRGGRLLK